MGAHVLRGRGRRHHPRREPRPDPQAAHAGRVVDVQRDGPVGMCARFVADRKIPLGRIFITTVSVWIKASTPTSASTRKRPAKGVFTSSRRLIVPDVKILGIPAACARRPSTASRSGRPVTPAPGASLDLLRARGIPPYNQDHDKQPPARVVELKTRVRDGGRGALLHARVQLLDARRAQERDRLGVAALAATARGRQAGGGDGRRGGHAWAARAPSTICASASFFLNMYPVNQPEVLLANAASASTRRRADHEGSRELIASCSPSWWRGRHGWASARPPPPCLSSEGRGCFETLAPGGERPGEGALRPGRRRRGTRLEHALEQEQQQRAGDHQHNRGHRGICSS